MKKLIFLMLLLCSSLAGNAQASFSVRTGFGLESAGMPSIYANINSNISLGLASHWIFSPGVSGQFDPDEGSWDIYVPLQFGYKSRLGKTSYFIPKIGLSLGYHTCYGSYYEPEGFGFGPHAELGFEFGHFTIGLDGFVSLCDVDSSYDSTYGGYHFSETPFGAHLNIGIKF